MKMDCITYDGKFIANKENVFHCPRCFRTVSVPVISYWMPNTVCTCESPYVVHQMIDDGLQCPIGYKESQ